MKRSRTLIPVAIAAALLVSGCSAGSNGSADASGEACLVAGDASNAVKVSGKAGEELTLDSKTPVKSEKLQRTVLTEGKGDAPKDGQAIAVTMTMFSGVDGTAMQQAPESTVTFAKDQLNGWAYEALRCAAPDQRVALVSPVSEITAGEDPATLGLAGVTNDDSVVIVMDFGKVSESAAATEPGELGADELLKKAEGKAQKAPEGFPTVKLAENGEPTITIPEGLEAPTKLEVATLIEGDGEEVKPGDRVYVNYRGVIWRTGEEFDSSWSRGEPTNFMTTGVIPGFQKALEGQKVGSQVISVVPAEDGGYGAAALEQQGHKPDDVMVFVLDILGTVHAE